MTIVVEIKSKAPENYEKAIRVRHPEGHETILTAGQSVDVTMYEPKESYITEVVNPHYVVPQPEPVEGEETDGEEDEG